MIKASHVTKQLNCVKLSGIDKIKGEVASLYWTKLASLKYLLQWEHILWPSRS